MNISQKEVEALRTHIEEAKNDPDYDVVYSDPGTWNRYARMLIRNEEGKYLVLKNTKDGRNRWEFPGGKQEPGEDLVRTAQRETLEEVGIKVTTMRFLAVRSIFVENQEWTGEFWLAIHWSGEAQLLEDKFSALRWVTEEEYAGLAQIPRVGVDLIRLVREEETIQAGTLNGYHHA